MVKRHHGRWFVAVLLAGTAGCEAGTAPEPAPELDTGRALADHAAMSAVMSGAAWDGFEAVSLGIAGVAARGAGSSPTAASAPSAAAAWATSRTSVRAATDAIISPLHRGKTFVYDGARDEYVVDADRAGAPTNGVRFITYETNAAGRPIPGQERGWADLIDEGETSGTDIALRLEVVDQGHPLLEYATTLDESDGRGRVTISGFARGDRDQLDFDLSAVGSESAGVPTVDLAFDLGVAARDFRIEGSVHGMGPEGEGSGEVDIGIRHGTESLELDAIGTPDRIDGRVRHNGELFATVSGHPDEPVFRGGSGEELTAAEAVLLIHTLHSVGKVFQLLEDLMRPVGGLVALGVIL